MEGADEIVEGGSAGRITNAWDVRESSGKIASAQSADRAKAKLRRMRTPAR